MTRVLNQTRGPGHPDAVVFACDDGHLPFALFAADRILRTEPDGRFDVMICMPDISNVPQRHLAGPVRFCQVDFAALPEVPMVKAWISNATYFRWVLPAAFDGQYRSLFYLDTDTYLARAGIQRLFDSVDRPVPLAAVQDFQRYVFLDEKRKQKVEAKLRDLGGKNGEYYNAGVLLMQPEHFLAMDGTKRFFAAAVENVKYLPIHRDQDQGAMNLAFADDVIPLNPLYNWASRAWLNPPLVEEFKPYILHFAGRGKPWNKQDDPYIATFAPEYLKFLTREVPGYAPKTALDTADWRLENPKYGIRILDEIRTALYRRRFRRKLERAWNEDFEGKCAKMRAALAEATLG
ncbi:MAG: hypothetical protein KDA73_04205 [Rhodobacteraceae bacterium]|nr:hypothetical protein [Paracoccaceae bacterium]